MTVALAAVALGAALAPWIPLRQVSYGELARARDAWLLAALAIATAALGAIPHAVWLVPIGLWFLLTWRSVVQLPAVVTWIAIAGTWLAAHALPPGVLAWLPWAWLAAAAGQVALVTWRWIRTGIARSTGTLGSPILTAGLLALVAPFCPAWGWPVLAVGLWLTSSWTAFVAVAVSWAVLAPASALVSGAIVALGALSWWLTSWIEYTPRGNSLDSVRARLAVWPLILRALVREGFWRRGAGPGSMPLALRQWAVRGAPVALGDAHMELLHLTYEYGVLGVLAAGLFAVEVGAHLRLGDPWSAAAVSGAVLTLASLPCRVAPLGLTWLVICAGVGR